MYSTIFHSLNRRDLMIRELVQSYDVYEDLLAKSKKGVEFYNKLETNVARLLTRTRGVCKVQQEERDMAMARLKPKGKTSIIPTCSDSVVNTLPGY